jgi:hypothetical protein
MYIYSQYNLRAAPTEPEHILRKQDLDVLIGDLSLLKRLNRKKMISVIKVIAALIHPRRQQPFAVGVIKKTESNGRVTVQLLDATGTPNGKIIKNVILIPITENTHTTNVTCEQKIVFVIKQSGMKFGIPLNVKNCPSQSSDLNQLFSETTLDKEFFQQSNNIARLDKAGV